MASEKTTRPLSIVYKIVDGDKGPELNILLATRNGNKVVDKLQEDRDARVQRVTVEE